MLSGGLLRPPGTTVTIEFSEDVLLEIFDAYRRLFVSDPRYENIWNSRDGWFKLTHVCQNWRRLVHLSPSRLHVHLLCTPHRSSKAILLRKIPVFPILVDYRQSNWTKREVNLALAAIEQRSRVRGIFLGTKLFRDTTEIFGALSRPFPELESLEICSTDSHYLAILPTTFFLGSASSLRRLKLWVVEPKCLSPLLSTVTGLVELYLTLRVPLNTYPEESLIANLQRMSCLRRLEFRLSYPLWYETLHSSNPRPPANTGDIVPLPNLMQLVFIGHNFYLDALVAELAAPSLQHLDVEFVDRAFTLPTPHFCRFICDTDNHFGLVRLDFSDSQLQFTAETRSKTVHAQSFRISIPRQIWLKELGNSLSQSLATVEELVVGWDIDIASGRSAVVQWREFLKHTRQVKALQMPWQVALDVAHSFQQDGQEPAVDILPALEQVNMVMTHWHPPGPNSQDHVAIPDAFEPLIAARKKVGRPITLSLT